MKKIIALILAVWMTVSCTCVTAFAETKKYDAGGYLAFGDSFTRGMFASDNWANEVYTIDTTDNPNCRNVSGSYTLQVAEALGCDMPDDITDPTGTYWPCAQFGCTLAFVLDLLGIEDNFFDSDFRQYFDKIEKRYETMLYYFGDPASSNTTGNGVYGKTGVVGSIRDMVKKSDVITVSLGMSDVFNTPLKIVPGKYLKNIDTSDSKQLASAIASCLDYIYDRYNYFVESFPLLLDYLKENTTGDVVILGSTNPINGVYLTNDSLVPIGNALSALSGLMNQHFREWCKEYGFSYVDMSNVELGGVQNEISVEEVFGGSDNILETIANFSPEGDIMGMATHPTKEGYAQIAREILRALAEKDKQADRNIRVDLGRFDRVDYVLLDGQPVKNYSVSDYVLTIPNYIATHKNLTVATVNGRKTAVTTYQLSYHRNEGYSVYRIYTTNDASGLVKKAGNAVVKVVSKLVKLLKGTAAG